MIDGKTTPKARLEAKGPTEKAGCATLRSSHLQLISLTALKTWEFCRLDVKNTFFQAYAFDRAHPRTGKPRIPRGSGAGFRLDDCPAASHRVLHAYLLGARVSEGAWAFPSRFHPLARVCSISRSRIARMARRPCSIFGPCHRAPAFRLNDGPAASYRISQAYPPGAAATGKRMGTLCKVSFCGPRLYYS